VLRNDLAVFLESRWKYFYPNPGSVKTILLLNIYSVAFFVLFFWMQLKNIITSHSQPMYIWISELGQPLRSYFGPYSKFTISKAADPCGLNPILSEI